MKSTFLAAGFFLVFGSSAMAAAPTPAELRDVLKKINLSCGDTWCEGDYNYQFKTLVCTQGGRCSLRFTMSPQGEEGQSVRLPNGNTAGYVPLTAEAQCQLQGIRGVSEMVAGNDLTEAFSGALNDCIGAIEAALSKK